MKINQSRIIDYRMIKQS